MAYKLLMRVPTYHRFTEEAQDADFGEPLAQVMIREAEGVLIELQKPGHEEGGDDNPDIVIERRRGGWAVFIRHDQGDTDCVVCILDEGRTVICPEYYKLRAGEVSVSEDEPVELDRCQVQEPVAKENADETASV